MHTYRGFLNTQVLKVGYLYAEKRFSHVQMSILTVTKFKRLPETFNLHVQIVL